MGNVVALRKDAEPETGGPDEPGVSFVYCPDCDGTVFEIILKGDDIDYLECAQCRAWFILGD